MKNHTENVMDKLFPGSLPKNQYWAYLWINSLKFYAVSFYCMLSWRLSKYTKSKLMQSFFRKQKAIRKFPYLIFCMIFEEKYLNIFYYLTKFHGLVAFTLWDIGQCIVIVCGPGCEVINFEINLVFFVKTKI